MGDRANVHIKDNTEDPGVYLYTHWGGTDLPATLQSALSKGWRWNDSAYLARIIFDVMTEGQHGHETGFGISTYPPDGQSRVLTINCDNQTVSCKGAVWTFQEYIQIPEDKLIEQTWEYGA